MGWYCYLEDQLSFPFKARVRKTMDASPLKSGENVTVIALAHNQLCRVAIFVMARHGERDVVVPLAQLVPVGAARNTRESVADWHYWHDQGYSFRFPCRHPGKATQSLVKQGVAADFHISGDGQK